MQYRLLLNMLSGHLNVYMYLQSGDTAVYTHCVFITYHLYAYQFVSQRQKLLTVISNHSDPNENNSKNVLLCSAQDTICTHKYLYVLAVGDTVVYTHCVFIAAEHNQHSSIMYPIGVCMVSGPVA